MPDVLAGKSPLYERPVHLEFALRAIDEPAIVKPLGKLLSSGKVEVDRRPPLLALIARLGSPDELEAMLNLTEYGSISSEEEIVAVTEIFEAFGEAVRTRNVRPNGDVASIAYRLKHEDPRIVAATVKLLGLWKVEAAQPAPLKLADVRDEATEVHRQAVAVSECSARRASRRSSTWLLPNTRQRFAPQRFQPWQRLTLPQLGTRPYPSLLPKASMSRLSSKPSSRGRKRRPSSVSP